LPSTRLDAGRAGTGWIRTGRGAPASAHPEADHDDALDAVDNAETAEITIP
jgi:hypothetical protein